jgi:hypothetical protein
VRVQSDVFASTAPKLKADRILCSNRNKGADFRFLKILQSPNFVANEATIDEMGNYYASIISRPGILRGPAGFTVS